MVSCHGLRQPRVPFPSLACWYTVVPSLEALDVLSVNTMKYEALQKCWFYSQPVLVFRSSGSNCASECAS